MNDGTLTMLNDSFSQMPRGKQILSVAAEMQRAGHWLKRERLDEAARCYGYTAALMDKLLKLNLRPSEAKEYRIRRDELARYAAGNIPTLAYHTVFERVVIQLHPESWNAFFPKSAA